MSDDLSAFFAKKKDKKKKNIVKLDDVGTLLENKAKKQEEREREDTEDGAKGGDVDNRAQEESEWLDYDNTSNNRVEGLRITEMGLDDTEESSGEANDAGEKDAVPEPSKTWATLEKTESAAEIIPSRADLKAASGQAAPTARYVPPVNSRSRGGWGTPASSRIDINNQEMFPTFAAAEQIEKHKKEEVKSGWAVAGAKPGASSSGGAYAAPKGDPWNRGSGGRERDEAMAAARALSAMATPAPRQPPAAAAADAARPAAPAPEPARPAATPAEPSKPKYVPPHLRNKQ